MLQKTTQQDFVRAFQENYERQNTFSEDGLEALFDHLESWEEDTGIEMELDIIAPCCDFTEYELEGELLANYPQYKTIEEIEEQTSVIRFEGGFIVQNF